ncbi:3'-5' exonuclease domain-containing protein [Mycena sanguinolenta]|nr:3'-5' exonuclease domain-containing protein [Mycena sanguinolenta]
MIPIPAHGLRAIFFRTLRDHIMRWDPILRQIVDETCRRVFNVTFDVMLIRDPRWIQERVPRYVPPPSVLVPAIQHVYNVFANALDAESGLPLFNILAQEKADAVLELAREGYLSDLEGVVLYEKAGVDEYGLQKWKCLRGTNKLEGGPHGDIYRKFGALHGRVSRLLI